MATWRDGLAKVMGLLSPREAGAEVVAHDDAAEALVMQTLTGPQSTPSYIQTLQMALKRPERVDLVTQPLDRPGVYQAATPWQPGTIFLNEPGAPEMSEATRRWKDTQYSPDPTYAYDIGFSTPAMYGEPSNVLTHELAHFLSQMYGLDLPEEQEERLAQHQTNQPIDYPLLRAAWQGQQARGDTNMPYWQAVRRQMEGR